jgi:acetylornithine deacetylase/succinyl-diaminopimelate desuccinylase-like protein
VLFYGHYDVQPADPLDSVGEPPFEPVRKPAEEGGAGERIVARGAVDDKGQVMMFLEAMRAWHKTTGLAAGGVKMTVMLEGEEECGSVSLPKFVKDNKAALEACDVCVISDTGMLDRKHPAITYGVRGLAYTEVTLHAANQDLHSGLWGGRCPNPNTELMKILSQLWDKKRRVTIPGFYDDVRPISKKERKAWKKLKFNSVAALKKIGLGKKADVGEDGYTAMEREWGRPTAEINGMYGGYTGPGAKTVIPAKASAKVSFRLVADQSPKKITKLFFKWLEKRTPPGAAGSSPIITAATVSPLTSIRRLLKPRAAPSRPRPANPLRSSRAAGRFLSPACSSPNSGSRPSSWASASTMTGSTPPMRSSSWTATAWVCAHTPISSPSFWERPRGKRR